MLSDDTEFNSSGIGNITGTKYLENYEIYKQTLIEGLATGKTHFLDLFVTWNHEVFPRSQVTEDFSDSQPASQSGGGNMGGNQRLDMNNVANILKQLSFEENEEDEEEEEDRSDHCLHNDSEDNNDNDFYASDPPRAQSMTPDTAPVPSQITSVMIANAIAEPTNSRNAPTLTRNMHPADDGQHDRQSGSSIDKALAGPKKTTPSQTTRRSSSRMTKTKAVSGTDSNIPPVPHPIQPIDTAGAVPPSKPKRATRGTAKGKTRA